MLHVASLGQYVSSIYAINMIHFPRVSLSRVLESVVKGDIL
jgi:hypothetical protein